jgi:hypothetical protein
MSTRFVPTIPRTPQEAPFLRAFLVSPGALLAVDSLQPALKVRRESFRAVTLSHPTRDVVPEGHDVALWSA